MNNKYKNKFQKGISLYLTIVLLALMMSSVLTLSAILTSQMKIVFNLGNAVTAFMAADAGIERALYRDRKNSDTSSFFAVLSNGSRYDVTITTGPSETVIESTGSYMGIRRTIEARY